jgi:hypothetical protein
MVEHAKELYKEYKQEFFSQDKNDEIYLQAHKELEAIYSPQNSCSFLNHEQKNRYFDKYKAHNTSIFIKNVSKKVIDSIDSIVQNKNLDGSSKEAKRYTDIQKKNFMMSVRKLMICKKI